MGQFITNPLLQRDMDPKAERPWILVSDLRYYSNTLGKVVVVEAGYRSDMASVPWFCRRWFPQDGPWSLAAIIHDKFCDLRLPEVDNTKAAAMFLEAMTDLGVSKVQRQSMYRAVLWFGPKW